jgi:N-acetylglucosamine-6-phosphate deacetylase
MEGIKCGICHATHLYNAMTPLHHRKPGVVGAVFDSDITTEMIADGIHIAYPSIRVALKQKGTDRMVLITDAMMACTMPDGNYALGGQKVIVKDNAARLENGALAGSVLALDKAIRNIKNNTDYPLYEIVKMATYNPARHCSMQDHKGSIKEGFDADLVLFDEDINIKKVIITGRVLK